MSETTVNIVTTTDGFGDLKRSVVIGLTSLLTLVDLFAAQAILPSLTQKYDVPPAVMGSVVNAATFGMAAAGILIAIFSSRIDRRRGIWVSLALLSVPTTLLAFTESIFLFAVLRVVQGVFMSAAFTLTMAYLAEECSPKQTAGAMAAYITGNVASNLIGRFTSASLVELFSIETTFLAFAVLNLAGALLVFYGLFHAEPRPPTGMPKRSALDAMKAHLANPALRATFSIGFIILFAFIGVFTYVNFVLSAMPFSLSSAGLGLVYFVFLPAIVTTPMAGSAVARFGTRPTFVVSIIFATAGLMLTLSSSMVLLLVGLACVGVGTFFAQAATTAFVGHAADGDRATASGLYLASYYFGGLIGSLVLGLVFANQGWQGCVLIIAGSLFVATVIARHLK